MIIKEYCSIHCKGYQDTGGRCFIDDCIEPQEWLDVQNSNNAKKLSTEFLQQCEYGEKILGSMVAGINKLLVTSYLEKTLTNLDVIMDKLNSASFITKWYWKRKFMKHLNKMHSDLDDINSIINPN